MAVNVGWRTFFLLALGAGWLTPQRAAACGCEGPDTVEAAFSAASVVFEGMARSVEASEDGGQRVAFEVVRVFKGADADSEQLAIRAAADTPTGCAVTFVEGEGYLVFAAADPGGLVVHPCMRTRPTAQAADDLTALGVGVVPVDPRKESPEATLEPPCAAPKGVGGGCATCSSLGPVSGGPLAASAIWASAVLAWLALRSRPRRPR